jgi:hypothetical protein
MVDQMNVSGPPDRLATGFGLWETKCMSEKRTKADKGQREADQLKKKSSHRPPQNQGKKAREDFSQAAVRIAEEATEKG